MNNKNNQNKKKKKNDMSQRLINKQHSKESKKSRINQFLKEYKQIKKYSDDPSYLIFDYKNDISNFIKFDIHRHKEDTMKLLEIICNHKIAKTIKSKVKSEEVPMEFIFIIELALRTPDLKIKSKTIELYNSIVDKMLKKRVEKLSKATQLPKEVCKELLVIVPTPAIASITKNEYKSNVVMQYTRNIIFKLNNLLNDEAYKESIKSLDSIKLYKLFKVLFTEEPMPYIAIAILLTNKPYGKNVNINDVLVDVALSVFEMSKKKSRKNFIDVYVHERKGDRKRQQNNPKFKDERIFSFNKIDDKKYPLTKETIDNLFSGEKAEMYKATLN